VYLVNPPPSFRPSRPWHVPDEFESGRLLRKNLWMGDAKGFCLTFNRAQLDGGLPVREWAVVTKFIRRRKSYRKPQLLKTEVA
jgi:hypothetical protein